MPLYEVTIERTQQATLWIDAPDEAAARIDAEDLTDALSEGDWEFFDRDLCVAPRAELPTWADAVWVGGEDGDWVPADDYEVSP